MTDSTITKSKLFVEDIAIADGGSGSEETGERLTSTGNILTLTKLDLGHIPYRSFPGTPEDLLDGGQDIDILPHDIDAGGDVNIDGTLTVGGQTTLDLGAGYVKSSAGGVISAGAIAAGDLPSAIDAANIANGSISNAEFQYLDGVSSNIQIQLNDIVAGAAVQAPFAILQNRQNAGVDGGTATAGSWLIVPLNTEYEDANSIIDSSAIPAFSLAAGTYRIEAVIPFVATSQAQTRLYNVTDAAVQQNVGSLDMLGSVMYSYVGYYDGGCSFLEGTFTIAGTKQFRIEYYSQATRATYGFGLSGGFGVNVYAQAKFTKIA